MDFTSMKDVASSSVLRQTRLQSGKILFGDLALDEQGRYLHNALLRESATGLADANTWVRCRFSLVRQAESSDFSGSTVTPISDSFSLGESIFVKQNVKSVSCLAYLGESGERIGEEMDEQLDYVLDLYMGGAFDDDYTVDADEPLEPLDFDQYDTGRYHQGSYYGDDDMDLTNMAQIFALTNDAGSDDRRYPDDDEDDFNPEDEIGFGLDDEFPGEEDVDANVEDYPEPSEGGDDFYNDNFGTSDESGFEGSGYDATDNSAPDTNDYSTPDTNDYSVDTDFGGSDFGGSDFGGSDFGGID